MGKTFFNASLLIYSIITLVVLIRIAYLIVRYLKGAKRKNA